MNNSIYVKYIKRILDIILALIFIALFFWLYILIAILVKINIGSPIIFKQVRPGKIGVDGKEKLFTLYKFRTMLNTVDKNGNLLSDELRLTKFGKMLRSTSLDELPEIFNILIGDMSFVGPRPLLVKYLPLYNEEQRKRHEIHPGLTGYAQINGRNAISWEEKFKYDLYYVNNVTFLFDIKILFSTVIKIILRSDINNAEDITMPDFEGTKK